MGASMTEGHHGGHGPTETTESMLRKRAIFWQKAALAGLVASWIALLLNPIK
jgi:hypothetical protein